MVHPTNGIVPLAEPSKRVQMFAKMTVFEQVELVVKNQEPPRVELWVDTDQPVDLDVEFKDTPVGQPGS
jgi:hypothetical protein